MSESKQPISVSDFKMAIKDLSEGELKTVKQRLEVSIERLRESNKLMSGMLKKATWESQQSINNDNNHEFGDEFEDEVTKDDIKIYSDSIYENEFVIDNQTKRISAIQMELSSRGEDDVKESTLVINENKNVNTSISAINSLSADNDVVDSTAPNSILI